MPTSNGAANGAANGIDHKVILRMPHPFLTSYEVQLDQSSAKSKQYRVLLSEKQPASASAPRAVLHDGSIYFTIPEATGVPEIPESDNTAWARARRSLVSSLNWTKNEAPSLAQAWTVIYALFTLRPAQETFRLVLSGSGAATLRSELQAVGLAIPHPIPLNAESEDTPYLLDELLVTRSTFWQGAGSPFGSRPAWVSNPKLHNFARQQLSEMPPIPLEYTFTQKFPDTRVYARHPVRPQKPSPGQVMYSRFVPHLGEFMDVVAADWQNEEHVRLFNKWQNDPRVAAAWKETGTLEEHTEYLRRQHVDDHLIACFGKFNDDFFGYFEIYWAKEDHVGAYYDAGDYDRGWHALVGEDRFRGPHRVRAWMSAVLHYMFLDDPRTQIIVGEPKATGEKIIAYETSHGFFIEKLIDFPHKRAALVLGGREKFFQLAPFHWGDEPAGLTAV